MILLDSNILIYTLHRAPNALAYMKSLSETPYISVLSVMELYHGVSEEYDAIKTAVLLEKCEIINVNHSIAKRAGEFLSAMRRRGKKTHRKEDMLIAATALSLDATLVTANWKDFQHIAGLKVEKFVL